MPNGPRWDSDHDAAWSDDVQRDAKVEHFKRYVSNPPPTPKQAPTLRVVETETGPDDLGPNK